MEREFLFSKLELPNNDHIYTFIEFEDHPCNLKEDFKIGNMTVLMSDLVNTPIYSSEMRSYDCFNREIEWNSSYFKKIRLCLYRKLKDVKFFFALNQEMDLGSPTVI